MTILGVGIGEAKLWRPVGSGMESLGVSDEKSVG